ncbi:hypothetical protein ACFQU7_13740 [Pseudoroseomonas wenyumeiae]
MLRRTAATALSAAALMPVLLRTASAQTAAGGNAQLLPRILAASAFSSPPATWPCRRPRPRP